MYLVPGMYLVPHHLAGIHTGTLVAGTSYVGGVHTRYVPTLVAAMIVAYVYYAFGKLSRKARSKTDSLKKIIPGLS
jgi:hypothetical protein